MIERIFQALPNFCPHRQIDTMFALIYKIASYKESKQEHQEDNTKIKAREIGGEHQKESKKSKRRTLGS